MVALGLELRSVSQSWALGPAQAIVKFNFCFCWLGSASLGAQKKSMFVGKKLRLREAEGFARSHTAADEQWMNSCSALNRESAYG